MVDQENVEKLIKKRSSIKGQLTICKNYIDTIMQVPTSKLSTQQISELKLRLAKLDKNLSTFDILQTEIEMLFEDASEQFRERELIENNFFTVMSCIQSILDSVNKGLASKRSVSFGSVGQCSIEGSHCGNCNNSNVLSNIALPTIKLPTFDGSYQKWLEYRDTFLSMIHNNDSLSEINKFHYLRASLEGNASSIIKCIQFSGDNYNQAWNLLCERFNNKRLLINNHIKSIFSIEKLITESDTSLRYILDTVSKNLQALKVLGLPVEHWDVLLIYVVTSRLDQVTYNMWEEHKSSLGEIPTLSQFTTFLRNRADFLETIKLNNFIPNDVPIINKTSTSLNYKIKCILCQQSHRLFECNNFISMNLENRHNLVSKHKLCINCLGSGHFAMSCRYKPCKICKFKHNVLLHKSKVHNPVVSSNVQTIVTPEEPPRGSDDVLMQPVSLSVSTSKHILLSTALVRVINNCSNEMFVVRALLDSGSQISLITESLRAKLGICSVKNEQPMTVSGIGDTQLCIAERCSFVMNSYYGNFSIQVNSMVVPRITSMLPNVKVNVDNMNIPKHVLKDLADPQFYEPAEVGILIGADLYWEIVNGGQMKLGRGKPTLQHSNLGWLVCGPIGIGCNNNNNVICQLSIDVSKQLERFWSIEEVSTNNFKGCDDEIGDFCEMHFKNNTYRLQNGRFCTKIPFHTSPLLLGDSLRTAKQRFYNLEMRFRRQPHIKSRYIDFIREYEELGHLSQSSRIDNAFYLPHHPVLREKSETTKLRVVFDASMKSTSGQSLNDIQAVGKVIQDDLFSILVRFRKHNIVFTADIAKMYRQIMIAEEDRQWQMIVWRENEHECLKYYKLNTLTYGFSSAPFISTRCLFELASECSDSRVQEIIKHDFYMDDILSGGETKQEVEYICNSVIKKLNEAGFELRKFRSNLNNFFHKNNVVEHKDLSDITNNTSTLGLLWSPETDLFIFPINFNLNRIITKRKILSMIAKIFDPLGLLSIFIVKAKLILQAIWKCKLGWDEIISEDISIMWDSFVKSVSSLTCISVPRHVMCKNVVSVELHLFCDASQAAYGTCAYVRSLDNEGNVTVKLLCAKSRVSPIKAQTIPRLELCGALLSAEMGSKLIKTLRCNISRCVYWTDSMVVLGWLRTSSVQKLNVFVANRVNKINELIPNSQWKYVPTKENPADLISRGVDSFDSKMSSFWWGGPQYLCREEIEWPNENFGPHNFINNNSELNSVNVLSNVVQCQNENELFSIFNRFSKLSKLRNVFAYILRFINNCRNISNKQTSKILTVQEQADSTNMLIKLAQSQLYCIEFDLLKNKQQLPKKCKLLSLNPFIDSNGIIRVGGRIENSSFSYDKKHPVILDSKHRLSYLIFEDKHRRLLHAGPQLLLASVREIYWIVNGRNLARSIPHRCIVCRRMSSKTMETLMGNLPKQRLTPGIPFESTGVDYAGPFYITDRKGRGCKISKCYLCVFVCFTTKAVHLEAVSDLSTPAFLLSLKRFVARRGKPRFIFCDNGSNFVGAKNELNKFFPCNNNETVMQFGSDEGITFIHSPPYTPHMNGLFEAGVKSAKFHIRRVLGDRHLTYEELATLFYQIEAILNSRPLCPLSSDPADLSALTPGHFLIGRPLTSIPSETLTDIKLSRLDRYEQLQQMKQHFWNRWSTEYVVELQTRTKWRQRMHTVQVGDMVLLKEENQPPLKWRIGRINTLFPGRDGITRVVDVRTSTGIVRRALSRLCTLPVDELKKEVSPTGEDV